MRDTFEANSMSPTKLYDVLALFDASMNQLLQKYNFEELDGEYLMIREIKGEVVSFMNLLELCKNISTP